MLEGVLLLQTFYYSGGGQFGGLIDTLSQVGFFSYILPFLLIFAIVYGILLKTKVFEKNAINGIISLAVALLALQFDVVPMFFSELFPRLGVGLAIILVCLILLGLFLPNQPWIGFVLLGVSALIVIIILYQSAGSFSSGVPYWVEAYLPLVIGLAFIIFVVILLTREKKATSSSTSTLSTVFPWLASEPK